MTDEIARLRARIDVLERNLAATEEAYTDGVDRAEETRALLREQIQQWRRWRRSWKWIRRQPAARAFYGPMGGT